MAGAADRRAQYATNLDRSATEQSQLGGGSTATLAQRHPGELFRS